MAILHGRKLIISVGGTAIAGAKSCSISVQGDTIETASPSTGAWKTYIAGRKGATVTCSFLVIDNNFKDQMQMVNTTITLSGHITGVSDSAFSCSAIVKEWKVDATIGNLAQGSFNFLVSGAISFNSEE